MQTTGAALLSRGVKRRANAVGPSEGKTNGVRVTIASSDRMPIDANPATNRNAATGPRPGGPPVAPRA